MKILILGGTVFLGRHIAESALVRGHELTLFNRGTREVSFGDAESRVERLVGDRNKDLSVLDGRRWDAVIDTCGFTPSAARASAERLASSVDHYTFISSESVYAPVSEPGYDESAPVATIDPVTLEAIETRVRAEGVHQAMLGEAYGALKALCEEAVEAAMPGRALHVRAGLIVGPFDRSDRFTYWVRRISRGGDVLAPAPRSQPVQLVDVRDLADWIVRMAETRRAGVFNAVGPALRTSFGDMLEESAKTLGAPARFVWVAESFLLEQKVAPWKGLPLWLPQEDTETQNLLTSDARRAIEAGLSFRPLSDTVRAIRAWDLERGEPPLQAGLTPEREREVLEAWAARNSSS